MADYQGQLVRITDLAADSDFLRGLEFELCTIVGPAVLIPVRCSFIACTFAADPNVLIWEVPEDRENVLGAIRLDECSFRTCQFARIGLALRADAATQFREAIIAQEEPSAREPVAG